VTIVRGRRRFRSLILLSVLALPAGSMVASATPENANYKFVAEIKGSAKVANDLYSFEVSPPNRVYESLGWTRYSDNNNDKNTILVTGMSGYDTYALSVLDKGKVDAALTSAAFAKASYQSISFGDPMPANGCVMTPLDTPLKLSSSMVAFNAICISPKHQAFELTISWKSMILMMGSDDDMVGPDCDRSGEGPPKPSAGCRHRIDDMKASMQTFVSSFAFK
jgi:hypothetical protein